MAEPMFDATPAARRAALRDGALAQYERVLEIRRMEERINALFAEGRVHGTTHLALGQESLVVGLAARLRPDDIVTGTYRGHALALALGMSPRTLLSEIMGRTGGAAGGLGGSMHLSDPDIGLLPTFAIVGAGIPVAAGAALAFQTRGESRVAVALFGDGSSNIGAFHEALNLAAVWSLPVVFLCDNNLYGEYSRIDRTTPIEDLHRRADAYAMRSAVVDGMDLDAVQAAVDEAVEHARAGRGPTLLEAKTYRFAGHSRADTAPYRVEGELEAWSRRDPLLVARERVLASGEADAAGLDALEAGLAERIEAVVAAVDAAPPPGTAEMFANVWTEGTR